MNPSIGVAATFRDEVNALPGFLESASQFFDEIFLADCSMDMTPSSDGSLDIIRKWGLPDPPLWDLSNGFGAVRGQLLHTSQTDWTVILDIDERMSRVLPVLRCVGTESYPAQPNPQLKVEASNPPYDHLELLISKINEADRRGIRAVRFQRRHWFSFGFERPTQNWSTIKDYQLRCMKSRCGMGYTTQPKMHERAWDSNTKRDPEYIADDDMLGPFIDHYHCHFKPMEPDQRAEDIRAYDALHHSDTHTPIPTR